MKNKRTKNRFLILQFNINPDYFNPSGKNFHENFWVGLEKIAKIR